MYLSRVSSGKTLCDFMRILIIPTTDWFKHPTPHRHHYLADQLKKEHEVYVLHFDIFGNGRRQEPVPEITYLPAGGRPHDNLSRYYIKNWRIHARSIPRLMEEHEIEVVFAANLLPTIAAFKAARRMRNRGKMCVGVYDFSDYFPQSAAVYSENRISRFILQHGTKYLLNRNLKLADHITAVSKPLMDYAGDTVKTPVSMATNGVELSHFLEGNSPVDIIDRHKLGPRVIGFVGALERWIELETPLRAFPKILEKYPDAQFLIVGGSIKTNYDEELKKLAGDLGISDNVIFTGFVPYQQVPSYINAMNITLIPFRTDLYMANIALPDKLFEYLACGKQIISSELPEVRRIFSEVVHFYTDEPSYLKEAISILEMPGPNVKGLEQVKDYDWERIARELTGIFEDLWRTLR